MSGEHELEVEVNFHSMQTNLVEPLHFGAGDSAFLQLNNFSPIPTALKPDAKIGYVQRRVYPSKFETKPLIAPV